MRIAVLGAGRMGSWFARLLSKQNEVAVFDTDPGRTGSMEGVVVLNELKDLKGFEPELLINSVDLKHTIEAFEEAVPFLPLDCTLCDITSVKGELSQYYEQSGRAYISIHPMFGPTLGDLDNVKGENVVLIKGSKPETAAYFRDLFEGLGLHVYEYTFQEHDRMMAYSLTTPFVATLTFSACVTDTTVPGTTFARHMEIAQNLLKEDNELLTEILFSPLSLEQIEQITRRLEYLKHIIRGEDYEEADKFLHDLERNIGLKREAE
jgi:prephenate dehydrogenase